MRAALPGLRKTIRFVPPSINTQIFEADNVSHRRIALFTTTMHNIEKKGLPELLDVMADLSKL